MAGQPGLQHGAERGDAGAGGYKKRIARWIAEQEGPERSAHLDRVARMHGKQVGREMAVLDAVQAELEAVPVGWRGNGIRARDAFTVDHFFERDPLSRDKQKLFDAGRLEDEVPDLRRDFVRFNEPGLHLVLLAARASLALSCKIRLSAG